MAADLTQLSKESSEWCLASDVKLLAWLKGFSNQITQRTQDINRRLDSLSLETLGAHAELQNAFTSLHQLSNTQFVEQRIQEEDEYAASTVNAKPQTARPPTAPGPESFEQNVVPKYREAVHLAWSALGSQREVSGSKSDSISGRKHSFGQECINRPLPLILGTDAFLAEEYCGLPGPESERFPDAAQSSQEPHKIEPGHFASSGENEDGAKVVDSEEETVEEGWMQVSSKKQYSELEPAVTAALNFRAMLEEALRGPSLYNEPSSDAAPHTVDKDEANAATSAWQSPSQRVDVSHNRGQSGSPRTEHNGDNLEQRRASNHEAHDTDSDTEVPRDSSRADRADVNKDKGDAKQGRKRHVSFSTKEEPDTRAEEAEEPIAQQNGEALSDRRSHAALREESDEENFTFGAQPRESEEGTSSYTISFDDLFRKKAPLEPSTSSDGLSAEASDIGRPRMNLSGKNAAMDAITAALKQRQAPKNHFSGEITVENVSKKEDPHAGLKEAERKSSASPTQPLHSELSFGPVDGFVNDDTNQEDAEGSSRRTDHDRSQLEEASRAVLNGEESSQSRNSLSANTGGQAVLPEVPQSTAEESAKVVPKREVGPDKKHVSARNGDELLLQTSGRGPQAASSKPDKERTVEQAKSGSGLRRSSLFGDSDEENEFALPLFGNKQSALGSKRRGLFEDSDEEEGSGFGPQSSSQEKSLFGAGSERGTQSGGGLFDDWEDQTDGLFQGRRSEGLPEVAQEGVSEASKDPQLSGSGRQAGGKSRLLQDGFASKAVDESEGLFEQVGNRKAALSSDLFGDDEEDSDLFTSSRSSGLQDGASREAAKTRRVSALLDDFGSDEEEDPWEDRLAKLKEDKRT